MSDILQWDYPNLHDLGEILPRGQGGWGNVVIVEEEWSGSALPSDVI